MTLMKAIQERGLAVSLSESKRYIICGVVSINGKDTRDPFYELKTGDVVTVGKHKEFTV